MRLLSLRAGQEDIGPNMTAEGFQPLVTYGLNSDWCLSTSMSPDCTGTHVGGVGYGPGHCSITWEHHHHTWMCYGSPHVVRLVGIEVRDLTYFTVCALARKQDSEWAAEIVLKAEDLNLAIQRSRVGPPKELTFADVSEYKPYNSPAMRDVLGWDKF